MSLEPRELEALRGALGREPGPDELRIVAAEWSEHCSYKSSREHLSMLPRRGQRVVAGKGLDSGVLDVGGGYVVSVHIESHNHPSAVEPYGGAATGVGGVVRDILSAGTRPVAVMDGLRFGDPRADPRAGWRFRRAVAGIADYGNCIGVPTVAGEVEFDGCYDGYALVDVAAVGFGRRESLIRNEASPGDAVLLLGGPTGPDGIGGAQFASDELASDDRSAVQVPDPFAEKLVIEAVLEARRAGLIRAIKDLGGGGLSCAVSETADALSVGIEIDTSRVHARGPGMSPGDVMVSESQERMLVIASREGAAGIAGICGRLGVECSEVGRVTAGGDVDVRDGPRRVACMPASVVANAPPAGRRASRPAYLDELPGDAWIEPPADLSGALLRLLGCPNIASRRWAYGQYDHEVGLRTVVRPGRDAAVLRLDNGRHLAMKIDGNPKHCHISPRDGAAGCFEEACRNVTCTGAKPIGMVDHLQFGDPSDPGVFWAFLEALGGITKYARKLRIPCVGGKVSFYNGTPAGPIKPTPVIGVLGIIEKRPLLPRPPAAGDALVVVGRTRDEMGGSEYMEYVRSHVGGRAPRVRARESGRNMRAVRSAIRAGMVRAAHDCSKGGLAVAAAEMCAGDGVGCDISLGAAPGAAGLRPDRAMFSESHSRYLLAADGPGLRRMERFLRRRGVPYGVVGRFGGGRIRIGHPGGSADLTVDKAREAWLGSLEGAV